MATRIKPKRSETSSSVPTTSNLAVGEIAINSADQKIYTRDSNDNIVTLAQPGLLNVVEDTTPQLGGSLDVNGNSITSSADIQLDAETQIKLDANSAGNIWLQDNGTTYGKLYNFNGMKIESSISDNDFQISVNDGGSFINAITIDASEAGAATFNDKVILGANKRLELGDAGEYIYGDGTNLQFVSSNAIGFDASNSITLDGGSGGTILKAGGGTTYGSLVNSSGDLIIKSGTTTALTFSGANVTVGGTLNTHTIPSGTGTLALTSDLGLNNVVEDTTPQLGGDLDLNSSDITGTGNINITGTGTFSGDLTVDTNTLYVDSANNRVGIGTTSPARDTLHVHSSVSPGTYIHLTNSGTGSSSSDGSSIFVDTNGNFEINNRESASIRLKTGSVVAQTITTTETVINDDGANTDFRVESTNNPNMLFVDAGNSYVGVGGIPSEKLSVIGSNNTSASTLKVKDTDGRGILIESPYSGSGIGYIGTHGTSSALGFKVDGTERLNINTSGDVSICCSLTVAGDLTVSGTTTTVNTETINLADNVILLNSNATGSATENAGIEVERGDDANKTLIWNETTDKWTVGAETFNACTLEVDDGSTTWPISSKSDNLHIGTSANNSLTTGTNNIAVGCHSLSLNEDGANNIAIGQNSLCCATTPSTNIVIGKNSLCASDECTFVGYWNGSSYPTLTCSTTKNIVIGNDLLSNEIMSSYNTIIGNDIATCASSCVFSWGCTCTCNGQSAIPYELYCSYNNTLIGNCIAPFSCRVDKSVVLGSNIAFSTSNTCPIQCSQVFGYNIMNCAMTDCGGYGYIDRSFVAGSDMFTDAPISEICRSIVIGNNVGSPGTYTCKRTEFSTHQSSILLGDYVSAFGNSGSSVLMGICSSAHMHNTLSSVFVGSYSGQGQFACNNTRCTLSNQNVAIGSNAMGEMGYQNSTTPFLEIRDNTSIGYATLYQVSGNYNTALGSLSGYATTTGNCNTTIGHQSGCQITTGSCNVTIGLNAGYSITTGSSNIVIGPAVQASSATVSNETTIGGACLRFPGMSSTSGDILCYNGTHWVSGTAASSISDVVEDTTPQLGGDLDVNGNNITSSSNGSISIVPNGTGCLFLSNINVMAGEACFQGSHPTGFENIQLGPQSGHYWDIANGINSNCIQCCNTAIGARALRNHCHGDNNVAIGHSPLLFQISASDNVAVGSMAGYCNVSGERNVFIGHQSGFYSLGCCNTALGYASGNSITSGSNLTVLGHQAQPSSATATNEITLGDANITSFRIPGLQSSATDGQVLTYCSTNGNIVLKDAGGGCNWDPSVSGALCNIYISNTACSFSSGGLCNTVVGHLAGCSLTTSDRNTLIGVCAGMKLEGSSTCNNVAVGNGALSQVEEGNHNVAVGFCVMAGCTPGTSSKGCYNVAIGQRAGFCLAGSGNCNILIGRDTAFNLTTGDHNIAIGAYAMERATTNGNQVIIGQNAVQYLTGGNNLAIGNYAARGKVSGDCSAGGNIGIGNGAAGSLTSGACNISMGHLSGDVSSGKCNMFLGHTSGYHGTQYVTGCCNVVVGICAGQSLANDNSGSNNIIIGHGADFSGTLDGTCSNTIILGNSSHNQLIIPGLSAGQGQTLCFNGSGFVASDSAGVTPWQAVCTANFTAVAGLCYFVNTTSAAITATLPASASLGDQIHFKDYNDTFDTNNLTVGRNSHNIEGSASDLTVATEGAGFTLVYVDSTRGWVLKDV